MTKGPMEAITVSSGPSIPDSGASTLLPIPLGAADQRPRVGSGTAEAGQLASGKKDMHSGTPADQRESSTELGWRNE